MYSKWRKSGCRRNNGKRGERIIAMKTVTKLFNGEEDFLGGSVAKTAFPMQRARVQSLVMELDPTFSN